MGNKLKAGLYTLLIFGLIALGVAYPPYFCGVMAVLCALGLASCIYMYILFYLERPKWD